MITDYEAFVPLPIRQIAYILVGRKKIKKTTRDFDRVENVVNRARRAGYIPFEVIRDDTEACWEPLTFNSPAEFLQQVERDINLYRRDRQAGQAVYIEAWCETVGMLDQLVRVTAPYTIPVYPSGGWVHLTSLWKAAQRIADRNVPTVLLHLGDYDPSGDGIFERLVDEINAFVIEDRRDPRIDITPIRVALTAEQVAYHRLPTAPANLSDSRTARWTRTNKKKNKSIGTCQLEALPPDILATILDAAIVEHIDPETLQAQVAQEAEDRAWLLARLDV